jgi:hypothetical protein
MCKLSNALCVNLRVFIKKSLTIVKAYKLESLKASLHVASTTCT